MLATFRGAYNTDDRRDALEEAMKVRLGKGKKIVSATHDGRVWRALGYRIELRRDRATKDLELLFHQRGGEGSKLQ